MCRSPVHPGCRGPVGQTFEYAELEEALVAQDLTKNLLVSQGYCATDVSALYSTLHFRVCFFNWRFPNVLLLVIRPESRGQ